MKVEKRVLKQWQLMDDKNVHNSTIKVSFSNKIICLGQLMTAIMTG